jgi:hypothetical protein
VLKGTGANHVNRVGIAEIRKAMRARRARNMNACSTKDAKEDRRRLEIRPEEEGELSKLRAVMLEHPFRNTDGDELYTDPTRVVVCVLHVQMRTAEKVLTFLHVKCLKLNGGSKATAHDHLHNLEEHTRMHAKMGGNWGHKWEANSGKTQTIKGMQLKGFEVDKIFSLTTVLAGNADTLLQIIMPTPSPDYERRRLCIGAFISFSVLLRQQDKHTALDLTIVDKLGMIYPHPPYTTFPTFARCLFLLNLSIHVFVFAFDHCWQVQHFARAGANLLAHGDMQITFISLTQGTLPNSGVCGRTYFNFARKELKQKNGDLTQRCVRANVHWHIYIYVLTHVHVHVHVCMQVCRCACVHARVYTCMCARACMTCMHVHTCTLTHLHLHAHARACQHVHVSTCT